MIDYKALFESHVPAPGSFPACFAFSLHKAGSSLMHGMIRETCNAARIPALTIPDLLFREGVEDKDWRQDLRLLDFIEEGRVYFGFRYLPELLLEPGIRLREHRSVLLVRDPRDALVSQYFSLGGRYLSHRLPNKNADVFVSKWKATQHLDIDEYVVLASGGHLRNLITYQRSLDFDKVLLRRYEDIYFDKRQFLDDIFSHFNIPVDPEIIEKVARANDIRPVEEDATKHIRKGAPGDHREKLLGETVNKLNDIFRDVSRQFGYDLDA